MELCTLCMCSPKYFKFTSLFTENVWFYYQLSFIVQADEEEKKEKERRVQAKAEKKKKSRDRKKQLRAEQEAAKVAEKVYMHIYI